MIEYRVLGPLEVLVDGAPAALAGPKPRALLGVLLAHAGRPVAVDRLIDQLWGEAPPATASTALQVYVSGLRKVLGEQLETTPAGYLLRAEHCDHLAFEELVGRARKDLPTRPARASAALSTALELWRGEPYSGVPAGSDVAAATARLTELRLAAIGDRLDAELAVGRHEEAVAELAGLAVDHPTDERLAGLLMLALHRSGRSGEARRAYATLESALKTELNAEPGEQVAALARAIDRRDPTLDPPTAIPGPASRFIGRRAELDRLADVLGRGRLVTLTGLGGSGKTRLALELARDTAADHPDGVHVVELAGLDDGVAARLAGVLDVRERTTEPLADTLARHIGRRRALVLLDNCEHLTAECAELAAELLRRCPSLRMLATSREPLGVPGEQVWPVAGLRSAEGVRSDAVRLLADRGAAARPGFAVHTGNAEVAVDLCRRLDGLPLAIELIAAQLRTLSLDEAAARIGRRLDLADARARTTPARHRTMRAAIDVSYQLLAEDERELADRLSVFHGGWQLDAAERVGGPDAYDVLVRLADRSVVLAEQTPGGTRYRMLELVSEYAAERLGADTPDVRRSHAEWCDGLARSSPFGGPGHAEAMARLRTEQDNLRAAAHWCLGPGGDPALGLSIASELWWFWWLAGAMTEARGWLRTGLDVLPAGNDELRAAALRSAAALARNSGDHAEARELGELALAAFEELGDSSGTAAALNGLCITAHAQRDYTASIDFGERCRELAVRDGDERRIAAAVNNIAGSLRTLRRYEEARTLFLEALKRFTGLGDRRGEAAARGNLGMVARHVGDWPEARRQLLASLAAYVEVDLPEGQLDALDSLASVELAEGRPAAALRLLTVAARERVRLGAPLYSEDEIADQGAALAGSREALGPRAAAVADSVRETPLAEIVQTTLARG